MLLNLLRLGHEKKSPLLELNLFLQRGFLFRSPPSGYGSRRPTIGEVIP